MDDDDSKGKLPKMWVGYVIAALMFVEEVIEVAMSPNSTKSETSGYFLLFSFGGWIYWLYCVYRFHDVLAEIPGYDHAIAPGRAVGMHFIPFYNLYWVFKWPSEIATFVNWRTQAQGMNGKVAGLLVLVSALVYRAVDSPLGLALLFSSGLYISRHLRKAFGAAPVPASAMAPPGPRGPLGL